MLRASVRAGSGGGGAGRRGKRGSKLVGHYVVSEALSNAAKHAHASVVHVELEVHNAIVSSATESK